MDEEELSLKAMQKHSRPHPQRNLSVNRMTGLHQEHLSIRWNAIRLSLRFLLERKVMINPDSILKSRDITLPTKVRLVKAMVFQIVIYGCESWTINKAERQRIDAFELWCWRRLLKVP